jgi:hypothetical protein
VPAKLASVVFTLTGLKSMFTRDKSNRPASTMANKFYKLLNFRILHFALTLPVFPDSLCEPFDA